MPCRCDYDGEQEYILRVEADKATRAACDLRTILRRGGTEENLTEETKQWIKKHDEYDAKRIKEENIRGERERIKK